MKEICPSSEFSKWKIYFALKWKKYDRESYEHGLTRKVIADVFGGGTKLEKVMLQNMIGEAPKDFDWMTEEEQKAAIAKSKAAHGYRG